MALRMARFAFSRGRLGRFAPLALLLGLPALLEGCGAPESYSTFAVRRGTLEINIVESGNVEAAESQEVVSEARGPGPVQILYIVPEGTRITEQDVSQGLVLVELDSSAVEEKLEDAILARLETEMELSLAEAANTDRPGKSEHAIRRAEASLKRTRRDLEQYLGARVAEQVIAQALEAVFEFDTDVSNPGPGDPGDADSGTSEKARGSQADTGRAPPGIRVDSSTGVEIDFTQFLGLDLLEGGEASHELSVLRVERSYAAETLTQWKKRLSGLEAIKERQLAKQEDMEALFDAQQRVRVAQANHDDADSKLNLYVDYTFSTTSQKLLAYFVEAARALQRVEKNALIEMDMEGDKLRALEAKHRLETERIEGYRSQVAKHTIRAERPGLVVYGPPELRPRYNRRNPIREGTQVRERQVILTIPDMSTAAVNVKIHESAVQRVAEGQPVRIRVNANPDVVIAGQVTSVAELPDAGSRFMNPSMNAYEAIIRIEETHNWLRPGMSAEVEILVDRIEDALYVPLQAVLLEEDGRACYVLENGRPARRVVTTGSFSNDLIAIRSGLEEGEEVLLRPSAALKQ